MSTPAINPSLAAPETTAASQEKSNLLNGFEVNRSEDKACKSLHDAEFAQEPNEEWTQVVAFKGKRKTSRTQSAVHGHQQKTSEPPTSRRRKTALNSPGKLPQTKAKVPSQAKPRKEYDFYQTELTMSKAKNSDPIADIETFFKKFDELQPQAKKEHHFNVLLGCAIDVYVSSHLPALISFIHQVSKDHLGRLYAQRIIKIIDRINSWVDNKPTAIPEHRKIEQNQAIKCLLESEMAYADFRCQFGDLMGLSPTLNLLKKSVSPRGVCSRFNIYNDDELVSLCEEIEKLDTQFEESKKSDFIPTVCVPCSKVTRLLLERKFDEVAKNIEQKYATSIEHRMFCDMANAAFDEISGFMHEQKLRGDAYVHLLESTYDFLLCTFPIISKVPRLGGNFIQGYGHIVDRIIDRCCWRKDTKLTEKHKNMIKLLCEQDGLLKHEPCAENWRKFNCANNPDLRSQSSKKSHQLSVTPADCSRFVTLFFTKTSFLKKLTHDQLISEASCLLPIFQLPLTKFKELQTKSSGESLNNAMERIKGRVFSPLISTRNDLKAQHKEDTKLINYSKDMISNFGHLQTQLASMQPFVRVLGLGSGTRSRNDYFAWNDIIWHAWLADFQQANNEKSIDHDCLERLHQFSLLKPKLSSLPLFGQFINAVHRYLTLATTGKEITISEHQLLQVILSWAIEVYGQKEKTQRSSYTQTASFDELKALGKTLEFQFSQREHTDTRKLEVPKFNQAEPVSPPAKSWAGIVQNKPKSVTILKREKTTPKPELVVPKEPPASTTTPSQFQPLTKKVLLPTPPPIPKQALLPTPHSVPESNITWAQVAFNALGSCSPLTKVKNDLQASGSSHSLTSTAGSTTSIHSSTSESGRSEIMDSPASVKKSKGDFICIIKQTPDTDWKVRIPLLPTRDVNEMKLSEKLVNAFEELKLAKHNALTSRSQASAYEDLSTKETDQIQDAVETIIEHLLSKCNDSLVIRNVKRALRKMTNYVDNGDISEALCELMSHHIQRWKLFDRWQTRCIHDWLLDLRKDLGMQADFGIYVDTE
ncbi:hypothetical protein D5R81_00735 [Parashewanella spongiae]|uniref:Uncharacterized protein n=1 Tax=Parashewanella spongiae TaxID=342950 RepID=A0A3A6TTG5_9GAMM|nr:hypothetical protein [Parashewanella spongiae]MCL1076765.1 hypothetical protein [Parashewanella spongiae]RJY19504.1 hypothetical protein D5R81_00735 [Parashewanella spongiae]